MGYSTYVRIAYGMDMTDHGHIEIFKDEDEFDDLMKQLGHPSVLELDRYGDYRCDTDPVVIVCGTNQKFYANDISSLRDMGMIPPAGIQAIQALCGHLNITPQHSWVVYGVTL